MAYFQTTDGSGVLVLAPGDNIAVATTELPEGTEREIAGARVVLASSMEVGHKFALRAIIKGERIVKYGAPIGVASRPIAADLPGMELGLSARPPRGVTIPALLGAPKARA